MPTMLVRWRGYRKSCDAAGMECARASCSSAQYFPLVALLSMLSRNPLLISSANLLGAVDEALAPRALCWCLAS
jgi:hypothetical protein